MVLLCFSAPSCSRKRPVMFVGGKKGVANHHSSRVVGGELWELAS